MNMDLATFLAFSVVFWAGYITHVIAARRRRSREMSNKFICQEEGCFFRAESSDPVVLQSIMFGHEDYHVGELRKKNAFFKPINSCGYIMPDGSRCLQESCAAVHMTKDGHDFYPI